MSYNIFKQSIKSIIIILLLTSVVKAETTEEKIARIEASLSQTAEKQKETESRIKAFETKYKDVLPGTKQNPYDEKIAKARQEKQTQTKAETSVEESVGEEINLFGTEPAQKPAAEKKIQNYPLERQPQYEKTQPAAQPRGRRPFTRSQNDWDKGELNYAVRKNAEILSFAKEEDSSSSSSSEEAYTGTNENNVFIFSDNIANYCRIDTTSSSDEIVACLNKVLKDRSAGSQMAKDNVNQMYIESMQDTTIHAVADAAKYKNDSSGFEANVLVPLQEKSAKATDERGDIEVLTLIDMENYKTLNKLIQVYATNLSVQAFNDFGSYEMKTEAISDISDESNAAAESKSSSESPDKSDKKEDSSDSSQEKAATAE